MKYNQVTIKDIARRANVSHSTVSRALHGHGAIPTRTADRIKRLAAYIGLEASFDAFLAAVIKLRADLGVPHTLEEFKVDGSKRELIGDMAVVDPTAGGNPIELTRERALDIFDRAMDGRL